MRKLTLLVVSSLAVLTGAALVPGLPEMERHFGPDSGLWVRLTLTLPPLFSAVGAPIAGHLVDRVGRKLPLLFALGVYSLAGAAGGLLDTLPGILASRAVLGLAVATVLTSATALIADLWEGRERETLLGHQAASFGFGGVVFLVVSGWLADASWRAPFALFLIGALVIPLVAAFVPEPPRSTPVTAATDRIPWRAVLPTYALAFGTMAIFYLVPVQIPFHLTELGSGSGKASGIAVGSFTLFGALVAMQYGRVRRRFSMRAALIWVFALLSIGYVVIGAASSFPAVVVGLVIAGAGMGFYMPSLNTIVTTRANAVVRGRALGGLTTSGFLGQFASPLLVAPIAGPFGLATAFFVGAAAMGLFAVVLIVGGRER